MGAFAPYIIIGDKMAQYWYKKDKRVLRISEQHDDRDVIKKVKELEGNGYVRINDRHKANDVYSKKVKSKPKPKKKSKGKKK